MGRAEHWGAMLFVGVGIVQPRRRTERENRLSESEAVTVPPLGSGRCQGQPDDVLHIILRNLI
jgi:hypothetical protein